MVLTPNKMKRKKHWELLANYLALKIQLLNKKVKGQKWQLKPQQKKLIICKQTQLIYKQILIVQGN